MKNKEANGVLKHSIEIIKDNLKNLVIIAVIILVSYSFLYGIWRIPVIDFGISRMTAVSVFDYLFIFLIAVLSSILIVLFIYEKKNITRTSSIS